MPHSPPNNRFSRAADAAREALGSFRGTSWLIGGAEGQASHTLRQGFLAALMIMVGSWGVGWLVMVPGSWLQLHQWLVPVRTTTGGVIACAVLLVFGALLLLRSWLRLSQRITGWEDPAALPTMRKAVLLWGAPLLACFPIFSRDVFSYLAQGGLLQAGQNPYEAGVSELPGWYGIGADELWAESPSPYGPLFLMLARGIWYISDGTPELAVLLFRGLSVFGLALMLLIIPMLARAFGSQPAWAIWLCLLNPLSLIVFVPAAHNDALMMGLALAGIWYALRRRRLAAWLLLIAAVAVKPVAMVLLPFAVLLPLDRTGNYLHRIREWVLAGGLAAGLLFGGGWLIGVGTGWFTTALGAGAEAFQAAPVGLLGLGLGWLTETAGGPAQEVTATVIYTAARIFSAVVLTVLLLSRRLGNPVLWAAYGLTVVILTSSIIQPWYVLWLLPLYAVVHVYRGRVMMLVTLLITVMTLLAMVGQLSVAQWLDSVLVQLIALAVAAGYLIYIVLLDPNTAAMFRLQEDSERWNAADGWLRLRRLSTPDTSWSAPSLIHQTERI